MNRDEIILVLNLLDKHLCEMSKLESGIILNPLDSETDEKCLDWLRDEISRTKETKQKMFVMLRELK